MGAVFKSTKNGKLSFPREVDGSCNVPTKRSVELAHFGCWFCLGSLIVATRGALRECARVRTG